MSNEQVKAMNDEAEFHPGDVLVKTEKGNRESRIQTAESSLPRRLRTLLMVVDGKTPFHVYEETLANYGDVGSLYEALVTGGYLECQVREHAKTGAAGPPPVEEVQPTAAPGAQPEPEPRAEQSPAPRAEPAPESAGNPEQPAGRGIDQHEFRELMSDISTLITEKLGSDAMELLLKVEAVDTPQQLLDLLPELAEELKAGMGSRDVKRFVSEVRKQLA